MQCHSMTCSQTTTACCSDTACKFHGGRSSRNKDLWSHCHLSEAFPGPTIVISQGDQSSGEAGIVNTTTLIHRSGVTRMGGPKAPRLL